MNSLFERAYNPDVLSCIANLSNDEVFTPPELANQVLDMLPREIWSDPDVKILDPVCKSGVFLREAAKRLIKGLEPIYPNLQERVDHIMHEQLYGIAITELTSLLSRRSLYCSKFSDGKFSVSHFETSEGNVRFHQSNHAWMSGKCKYCGVPKVVYDRSSNLESYAYEFIHTANPDKVFEMKFDVIIGNPPYQMNDGGGNGSSAMPVYHRFIKQAKKLQPRFLCMIVPAKWHSGGKGLDAFRDEMLHDKRISKMVTFCDSRDCFNGVDIAGGVTYFLWERNYEGRCESTYVEQGVTTTSSRSLNELSIFIASDQAMKIIRKVTKATKINYSSIVRSRNPFGIGAGVEKDDGDLSLRYRGGMTTISSDSVRAGREMINQWKVIISKASAEHAGQSDKNGQRKMISVIEILPPKTVCSETYLVIDAFDSKENAQNLAAYLKTKFVRYLLWRATPTQNISKNCFSFVPSVDLSKTPDDNFLYDQFNLSEDDRREIESKIKDIPSDGTDE